MERSSEMYCGKNVNKFPYWDFYNNPKSVKFCGVSEDKIIKVIIKETGETSDSYWGWWNNKKQRFEFVFPKRFMVTMCFPYDIKLYEKRGDGKLVSVEIIE